MSGPPSRRRIVLVTSNGMGLGHLSRELAVALAIGDRAEPIMFSFSRGLPLAAGFGFRGEFCPGPDSPWIPRHRWNKYVESRFELFLDEIRPEVVMFDGVAPYLGVINALRRRPAISAGWLRRGMWRAGPTEVQLAKSTAFDFVIEPGDIAAGADRGPTAGLPAIRVPPVSLLEVVPALDRTEAAEALGLDPDRPALLLGLGLGLPGDPLDARTAAIETALGHSSWQVGFITSPLADPSLVTAEDTNEWEDSDNLVPIQGVYPLIRYHAAFDAAINASGYNSVHELIPAQIPTLFIPKLVARTDDQTARAADLARRGLALIAPQEDIAEIRRQVDSLLGDARSRLVENLGALPTEALMGGAAAAAEILTSGPPVGVRETGAGEWRQPGLKGWLKHFIPPAVVEIAQQMLGRAPGRPPHGTEGESAELLVTAEMDPISSSSRRPVEHVIDDASPEYAEKRRALIDRFYDQG